MAGNLNCLRFFLLMINYLEYVCPIICFVVCLLHSIIESIIMSIQNKKIDRICDKCLQPIEVGSDHDCYLSESQLLKLTDFIISLRGDK